MKTAYQCYSSGEYIGPMEVSSGILPNGATWTEPPAKVEGFARFFRNGKWKQVEDHRGEQGYVDGVFTTIHDVGPYPAGWSNDPPAPSAEDKRQNAMIALNDLDAKSVRAARAVALAVANGNPPSAVDVGRLADIEAEAEALRKELAAL